MWYHPLLFLRCVVIVLIHLLLLLSELVKMLTNKFRNPFFITPLIRTAGVAQVYCW